VIGVDSNVVIRYLAQDDPVQAAIANRLIEEELTERAEQVWHALQAYARRGDFSDALISELALDAGCCCTRTFDVAASRQPGFELLG
jgi:predicted nucleic-acid-binding protein